MSNSQRSESGPHSTDQLAAGQQAAGKPEESKWAAGQLAYVLDDEPQVRAIVRKILASIGFLSQEFTGPVALFDMPRAHADCRKVATRGAEAMPLHTLLRGSGGVSPALRRREQVDHLAIEGWNVVGATACHEAAVDDSFLIDVVGAGVPEISPDVGLMLTPLGNPLAL